MAYQWISLTGEMIEEDNNVTFKGGTIEVKEGQFISKAGHFICDQTFGGGIISGEVLFKDTIEENECGFLLFYDPLSKGFAVARLGSTDSLFSLMTWNGREWNIHATAGSKEQLKPNQYYKFKVYLKGSRVEISVNDIEVLVATLPYVPPQGQSGIWAIGKSDIVFKNYTILREPSEVFVVMQFTPPYNELYNDVIVPLCKKLDLSAIRADEAYGPGIIVSEIAKQIIDAKVIIADITPKNPNVYYEVGYAHALNKPTILIAESPTQLPFDVSPYRVLFYENTIGGKNKIEKGLQKHLSAILGEWSKS